MKVCKVLSLFGFALLWSFLVSGLQSILFMAVMEWRFAEGMSPKSWQTVALSTPLGFVSGAVIVPVLAAHPADAAGAALLLGGVGAAVGLVIGLLIKLMSPRSIRITPVM